MTDWTETSMPQEQKQNRPSLMIATPMYGGMCTGNYVAGLLGIHNSNEVGGRARLLGADY
jgi:hypothetical protein